MGRILPSAARKVPEPDRPWSPDRGTVQEDPYANREHLSGTWTQEDGVKGLKGLKGYFASLYIYFSLLFLNYQGKTLHTLHQMRLGPRTWGRIDNRTIHQTVHQPVRNPSPGPRSAVPLVQGGLASGRVTLHRAPEAPSLSITPAIAKTGEDRRW